MHWWCAHTTNHRIPSIHPSISLPLLLVSLVQFSLWIGFSFISFYIEFSISTKWIRWIKTKTQEKETMKKRGMIKENENNKRERNIELNESQNWKTNNYDDESVRMELCTHNGPHIHWQIQLSQSIRTHTHTFTICAAHNGSAFEWR